MRRGLAWLAGLALWGTEAAGQGLSQLSGTVYDSVGRKHLANALVQLVPVDDPLRLRSTTTDEEGRFAFDSVGAGSWLVGFLHPTVDSLGISLPSAVVRLRSGAPSRVMLAIPSAQSLVRATCGALPAGRGLWYGRVRDAITGGPVAGAVVYAQWSALAVAAGAVQRQEGAAEDTARADGVFALCGVATDERVLSRAWRGADSSGVAAVQVPSDGLLYRDLWVAPVDVVVAALVTDSAAVDTSMLEVRRGERTLRGRVTQGNGKPVAGARLRVSESGRESATNAEGYFALDSLPAGTHLLEVRALGMLPVVTSVDLGAHTSERMDLVMESRGTFLDTVRVIGNRVREDPRYLDFLERKKGGFGYFMDEDQIERQQPFFVTDLLRMTPGVRLVQSGFGRPRIRMRSLGSQAQPLCEPAVFVDGMLMTTLRPFETPPASGSNPDPRSNFDIEQFVNVEAVRSIEVYVRNTQIPPQFQVSNGCGSIVITTGMRRRRPPAP